MFTRRGTSQSVVAVLALVGQLTPVAAVPAFAAVRPQGKASAGGCAAGACACAPVERVTKCCCSNPEPVPSSKSGVKGCCGTEPPAAAPHEFAPRAPHTTAATIAPGGSCRCDKPAPSAAAEPATPPAADSSAWAFEWLAVGLLPTSRGVPVAADHPPQPPPPRA